LIVTQLLPEALLQFTLTTEPAAGELVGPLVQLTAFADVSPA